MRDIQLERRIYIKETLIENVQFGKRNLSMLYFYKIFGRFDETTEMFIQ